MRHAIIYGALINLLLLGFIFTQPQQEFRAVKITNVDSDIMFSDKKIAEAMDYLADIGINTILVVVWNSNGADGDYTLYPSQVMEEYFGQNIHPLFVNRDPLKRIIIEAHRNGMEVLPWFEMGFSTSYSQNGGHILQAYPDWALKNTDGNLVVKNGFDWMSAINPEAQAFILALTVEVADNYDIDGIEYSDRIPAMPVEGGYDSLTVSIYKSEHNGNPPPVNYRDSDWMRWRADKLSRFFGEVRDSIKSRSDHLIVSSSPSIYPWSYNEYLQDSKTWVKSGIADNIIPQLYRYNYNDYLYELNKSLNNFPHFENRYYAGILVKSGGYVIDPVFLLKSIQANRDNDVYGEAFFFYEGLKANDNLLGDTLKATFYSEPALVPDRGGNIWRPKAVIVNEDDTGAEIIGDWATSDIPGFTNGILIKSDSNPGAIFYHFEVPFSAWFDVFYFNVTGPLAAQNAPFMLYSQIDSTQVFLNQRDGKLAGWQQVGSVYLEQGNCKVLKLNNDGIGASEKLTADAAMIMINRKKSPEVVVSSISDSKHILIPLVQSFVLEQNFPNPFNPTTTIGYYVPKSGQVALNIFNSLGQKIDILVNDWQSRGNYKVKFDARQLASGVYFYQISGSAGTVTKKMLLIH